jgi:hypothetical protein
MWYRAGLNKWEVLEDQRSEEHTAPKNIPLGIIDIADYEQFDVELEVGDLVLCYTDALTESKLQDRTLLGEEGLLKTLAALDGHKPDNLIDALLASIETQAPGGLAADDVTVLLLRVTGQAPVISIRQKLGASARLLGSIIRSISPRAQRPPLPDLNLANIGGAIIPRLAKRWGCPKKKSSTSLSA